GGWPIDRDLETFDTALSVCAFGEADLPVPRGDAVQEWLLRRQLTTECFATSAAPGGWAWAMPAGWPDCDDTSYVLLALRTLGLHPGASTIARGERWLAGMQNSDGSWSTFVRNSSMPFDHDCPYITGHVLSALKSTGYVDRHPRVLRRALAYLARAQRHDGSFASLWFREATAGTASVLEALAACGLARTPCALRARDALLRSQNDDGGWAGLRLQTSTAEETAWAVFALLRYESDPSVREAVTGGIAWLVANQLSDGTWTPAPIGLYYSAMWYSDSAFALTLPAQALGRAKSCHGTL
ncbi:MAG: Prenyltransferase/squalene oxidase, partial [Chloroflexi bacterium]|nr:Prenyltransferase/squalene oxidase [Chloroflexota bacterium]